MEVMSADRVYKKYMIGNKSVAVLNKVSLSVKKGEALAIIGRSGVGKSTLMKILGTIDKPDSGKIFYERRNLSFFTDSELSKLRNRDIGFVFQSHHLLHEFSVLENTMIPGLINKKDKKEIEYRSEKMLIRVGLKEKIKYRPEQLSGGERQRVAIARSLVQNPLILLADEPSGNLDKRNAVKIQNLLLRLNKEIGMALIIVTHDNLLAGSIGKKFTIFNGKLINLY